MKASDKITKAKVYLILNHPFFASLILRMEWRENKDIETGRTNGVFVEYNSVWVDTLSQDETVGFCVHEVMHPAMFHHTRRQNRDPKKWNYAADMPINEMLVASGFKLPPGGVMPPKELANKSAEEIYSLLPDMPNGYGPGCGDVIDAQASTQSELNQIESEVKQALAEAAAVAKQQGKLPKHLERLVEEILAPKVPWKEVLQRFLCQIAHNDYTWTKPNKRFIHVPLYMPSMESIETGNVFIFGDSSGSVWCDREMIDQFAAEVQDISNMLRIPITLIWVDTKVAGVEEIDPDEPLRLNPKGGGGTSFIPGFEYVEEHDLNPCAVVYLTDGYCDDFPKEPGYPVLWAVYNNKDFKPPFGEVVHI